MIDLSEIKPASLSQRSRDAFDAIPVQEAAECSDPIERESAAQAGELEEDHQLETSVDLVLGKQCSDQTERGHNRHGEPEALEPLGIDVSDKSLAHLIREQ